MEKKTEINRKVKNLVPNLIFFEDTLTVAQTGLKFAILLP
jgi:hypothetical protein